MAIEQILMCNICKSSHKGFDITNRKIQCRGCGEIYIPNRALEYYDLFDTMMKICEIESQKCKDFRAIYDE